MNYSGIYQYSFERMAAVSLQHESSIPLYIQIKELLQGQIRSGDYAGGARLPSERELAGRYAVSRMTARQALQALVVEGLVTSHVGKGTFVSTPKINQELRSLTSFSEDMRQRGATSSSRVLTAEVRAADQDIANHLHIKPGTRIVLLKRVRLANGQPLALETAHIPYHKCPGLLDRYDFGQCSLYEVLRQDYGWELAWADQVIGTRLPEADECEVLELDRGIPVLSFTRVTFDENDQPLEYVRSVYRGDQYQLRAILRYAEHQLR
jgi:GntR family transcriptional regulator